MIERSESSRSRQQLWKTIGYVKEGHLSEAERHNSPLGKADKKGAVYNSLIHHKLVVPQTQRSAAPQSNPTAEEAALSPQSNCKSEESVIEGQPHEDEFENVLKILKAGEEDLFILDNAEPQSNMRESQPLCRSEGFISPIHSSGDNRRYNYDIKPKYERVQTVEECPNSLQAEETMRSMPRDDQINNTVQLRALIRQLLAELKNMINQFRGEVEQERSQANDFLSDFNLRWEMLFETHKNQKPDLLNLPASPIQSENCESIMHIMTSEQAVETSPLPDDSEAQKEELRRLKELLSTYELELQMKSTLICDLQLKNSETLTTNQLTIERLTNQNNHLNEQLAEVQRQFEIERRNIRVRISSQQLNEALKADSCSSDRMSLTGKLKDRDRQIADLKQQLAEKCSTIEMLIQKLKEVQAASSQQLIAEQLEVALQEKTHQCEVLTVRIDEYERQLEVLNNQMGQLKRENHILNEDNFVMQQKTVGLDAEIEERLRQQRKLLTREHMTRIAALEGQNRSLQQRYENIRDQLAREREREKEPPNENERQSFNNYLKNVPAHDHRAATASVPMERQFYTRDPSRNFGYERQNSIGSLDSHRFGSAGEDTPRLVPILPIGDSRDRHRYQRQRKSHLIEHDHEYIPSSPPLLEAYNSLMMPSREVTQKEHSHCSQDQIFTPFYKELGPRRETMQPPVSHQCEYYPQPRSDYYPPTNHHHHRNINIHTANVHVNQQPVSSPTRYTFNPASGNVRSGTHLPSQKPEAKIKGSMQSPHQYSNRTSKANVERPVRDGPKRESVVLPEHPYMHAQKINLSRLQTQLENLTKELKQELATVSKKLTK